VCVWTHAEHHVQPDAPKPRRAPPISRDDGNSSDYYNDDSCEPYDDASAANDDEDEADDSTDDRVSTPRVFGTAKAEYVDNATRTNRWKSKSSTLTPKHFHDLCDDTWNIVQHQDNTSSSPYAVTKEIRTGQKFHVKYVCVPKAKLHMTHNACSETAKISSCECSRHCYNLFPNPVDVRRIREPVFTTCDDETAVSAYMTSRLQAAGGKYIIHAGKGAKIHSVCRLYYATIHGVSVHSVKKARQLAQGGRMPPKKRSPATKLQEKNCLVVLGHPLQGALPETE
jgi:hypothetical protein